ncbi:MAG: zf-HC2 domain-containing protein [Streptosporangiales bacterium]|nr:zf-HC2 domain-containing protein [Streptosporangiales bacterium]MBO0890782.1 zf-HC2 domain-containing protein [Acidothermales bacterium]
MTEDRFASYDAAYVIGALSAQDRQEFERHLHECDECARSVRELAGMPGLLAKVPEDMVTVTDGDSGPPSSLILSLLRRVRRERRRTRWTAIGAAGLAAAACLALVLAVTLRPSGTQQPVAIPTVTMTPQRAAPVFATVGLHEVAWGTRINMHCMYQHDFDGGKHVYTMVVVDKQGDVEQLGSWNLMPGKDAKLEAGTSWQIPDIASVEVRTPSGQTVLQMSP